MSDNTSIEWTDATWPVVVGCERISPGCAACYAVRDSRRLSGNPNPKVSATYAGLVERKGNGQLDWTGVVRCLPERLDWPLKWRKPRKIFVCNESDLFHDDVPFEFVDRVFAVMASASQHTFQILTKRPARMREYIARVEAGAPEAGARYEHEMREHFDRYKQEWREGYSLPAPPTPELRFLYDSAASQERRPTNPDGTTLYSGFSGGEYHWRAWPLVNVWLGVSCEDQKRADERIPLLLQTPAAVRFISAEPLLGPVNLCPWIHADWSPTLQWWKYSPVKPGPAIDWVIVGGESGPGARACRPFWIRQIVEPCKVSKTTAVFVKQIGSHVIDRNDAGFEGDPGDSWTAETRYEDLTREGWQGDPVRIRLRDRKGGDPQEWPEPLRVRQFPSGSEM